MKKILIFALMLSLSACNSDIMVDTVNPILSEWDTPFSVPPFDKIKVEHYMPAFEVAMDAQDSDIDSIINNDATPTFENTIVALDNSGSLLTRVSRLFFPLALTEADSNMLRVEGELMPILSQQGDKILLNETLFNRIKSVYDKRTTLGLSPSQLRLLTKTYDRFARNGANLSDSDKDKLKQINEDLSVETVAFGNNLLAANKSFVLGINNTVDLSGLPESIRDAAAEAAVAAGSRFRYLFTLDLPSLISFITYADKRELREFLYKGYLDRCNSDNEFDNKKIVNNIVRLRTERAQLLGYDSHSEFVLDNVMAKSPENVYSLLNTLWEPALKTSKEELNEMKEIMRGKTGHDDFQSWDWWYYAEKLRRSKYDLDEEVLRPYFSLPGVRAGIFQLSNRLFGVTFRPISVPVYNKDCQAYEVLDVDNTHLGILYMDFHPRSSKRGGAWCTSFRGQSFRDGERISPIVSIVCNFTPPIGNYPALLSLDEVTTFFHEFGHALHSLFSQVEYSGLRGVERDFVELPSQLLENWAFEPEMLRKYAIHYRTGQVMPDYLIEKILKSSKFNQGFTTLEYLAASITDLEIHTISDYTSLDLNKFEEEVLNTKRGMIPEIAPRYRYPYFSHIFNGGYSSGYYSYIWAEVLDKDAYSAFVESGDIFNKELADKFRILLSSGGTLDGMTLYKQFRGAEPSQDALIKSKGFE